MIRTLFGLDRRSRVACAFSACVHCSMPHTHLHNMLLFIDNVTNRTEDELRAKIIPKARPPTPQCARRMILQTRLRHTCCSRSTWLVQQVLAVVMFKGRFCLCDSFEMNSECTASSRFARLSARSVGGPETRQGMAEVAVRNSADCGCAPESEPCAAAAASRCCLSVSARSFAPDHPDLPRSGAAAYPSTSPGSALESPPHPQPGSP